MLRDAAAFATHDVDADNAIEQRRFPMIHVPQERYYRRTLDEIGRVVFLLLHVGEHLIFQANRMRELDVDAKLRSDELRHIPHP